MFRHTAFGLEIDSEIQLVGPTRPASKPADVEIRYGPPRAWVGRATLDEEFVRIASVAEFYIRGGREVVVSLKEKPTDMLRVLLSGRIMAYLLRQRGWLPLHASAVRVGERAVLFLAPIGTGKSTTAAAFHSRGHQVLGDDVAPVRCRDGKTLLCCGNAGLRLCTDAAEAFQNLDPDAVFLVDKHYFTLDDKQSDQIVDVARIYLLVDGDSWSVQPVTGMEAVTALGRECFIKLHRAGPAVLQAHLRDCAAVAGTGVVRKLVRPRDLSRVGELVGLVERDLFARSGILEVTSLKGCGRASDYGTRTNRSAN